MSGHLFSIGTIQPFNKLNAALGVDGGGLSTIIHDTPAPLLIFLPLTQFLAVGLVPGLGWTFSICFPWQTGVSESKTTAVVSWSSTT